MNKLNLADARNAASVVRARVKLTDVYAVTVGGYIIGRVQRIVGETTSCVAWRAFDDDGNPIHAEAISGNQGSPIFGTRQSAMSALARSDNGAVTYRAAALEGAFGTYEQVRVKEYLEQDFPVDADAGPERVETTLAEVRPGDRIVSIEGEETPELGPVVLEAAQPLYGHGPLVVRISGPRNQLNFLEVDNFPGKVVVDRPNQV